MKGPILLSIAMALFAAPHHSIAQSTAFTYQGQLNSNGTPMTGTYDFQFKLFCNGSQAGNTVWTNSVPVTNGQFTAMVDFGSAMSPGSNYWLQLGVRTNSGSNYAILEPLQAITSTPFAIFATTASSLSGPCPAAQLTGSVPSNALSGTYGNAVDLTNPGNGFSGNGSSLTSLNASQLASGIAAVSIGGTGANSARAVGANVGTYQASPVSGNNAFGDISSATPAFVGQAAMSCYGNHFPFFWTAISTSGTGQANWTGSAYFAGRFIAGDATHMNPATDIGEDSFTANGTSAFTVTGHFKTSQSRSNQNRPLRGA